MSARSQLREHLRSRHAGVGFRAHGNTTIGYKTGGKKLGLVGYCQFANALQRIKPPLSGLGIACSCLGKNKLRSEQFVIRFLLFPPLRGELLPSSGPHIPSRSRCQVARDRGLYVNRFHLALLYGRPQVWANWVSHHCPPNACVSLRRASDARLHAADGYWHIPSCMASTLGIPGSTPSRHSSS